MNAMPNPIRPMEPRDLNEVIRIIRLHDSEDAHHARAYFKAYFAEDGPADGEHMVYVDEKRKRLVGVAGYHRGEEEAVTVYWIGWIYVHREFSRRGIGTALMNQVLSRVRTLGGRKIYTDTSSLQSYNAAVAFYKRCGFLLEAVMKDYYRDGEDCLLLARRLD